MEFGVGHLKRHQTSCEAPVMLEVLSLLPNLWPCRVLWRSNVTCVASWYVLPSDDTVRPWWSRWVSGMSVFHLEIRRWWSMQHIGNAWMDDGIIHAMTTVYTDLDHLSVHGVLWLLFVFSVWCFLKATVESSNVRCIPYLLCSKVGAFATFAWILSTFAPQAKWGFHK